MDQTPVVCHLPLFHPHVSFTVMVSGCPCAQWIYKAHPPWGSRRMHMKCGCWGHRWVAHKWTEVVRSHECKHISDAGKANAGFVYASPTLGTTMGTFLYWLLSMSRNNRSHFKSWAKQISDKHSLFCTDPKSDSAEAVNDLPILQSPQCFLLVLMSSSSANSFQDLGLSLN